MLSLRFNRVSDDQYLAFSGQTSEFMVGVIKQIGPGFPNSGQWHWSITGIHGIGASGAEAGGYQPTLEGAQRMMAGAFLRWVEWAGLRVRE